MTDGFYNNAVYWVETNRITPNPFQPRKEFDEKALADLADSIRQYGVLQPLTVTRREIERTDGGISVEYELVAGERRLRASKIAGVTQVPVLIRSSEDSDKMKLELAIIENLQREDLNPVDRALAFKKLAEDFSLKHTEIAKKVGKSREYVSNTLRLLNLPEEMQNAMKAGKINEGHARPLLMLIERPEQQKELFIEIMERKLAVREAERISRRIATDRARKQDLTPDLQRIERALTDKLGTRVIIETKEKGGKVHIDFFSPDDLEQLLQKMASDLADAAENTPSAAVSSGVAAEVPTEEVVAPVEQKKAPVVSAPIIPPPPLNASPFDAFMDTVDEKDAHLEMPEEVPPVQVPQNNAEDAQKKDDAGDDLYSIKNFSI